MQVGDLVRYRKGAAAIPRKGIVLEELKRYDGLLRVRVHWDKPDPANGDVVWWERIGSLEVLSASR